MKRTIALLITVASLVCTVSLAAGAAEAREEFVIIEGIPVEALSLGELAAIEGKFQSDAFALINRPSPFIFSETSSAAIMNFSPASGGPLVFPDMSTLLTNLPFILQPQQTIALLAPLGLGNLSLGSGQDLFALLGLFR